jgi:HEPN domain-containing protein
MPPDPQRQADTRGWFRKAYQDLRYAEIDLAATPPAPEDALFHCQQAVEKVLKGFLAWHDEPFPKTHDLGKLGRQAIAIDPTLDPVIEQVVELTKYAWLFRYPGNPMEPSVDEATQGLRLAQEFVQAVLARLPDEVRPPG